MNMKNSEKTTRKQSKSKVVTFRLTPKDFKIYENFCVEEQIKMSVWLREQVRNKIATLPDVEFVQP